MLTSIVFFIFNRPDTTKQVFEAIRLAKPKKLLVVADGPRPNKSDEAEKCAAVRAIIELVDWNCEVLTNYSDTNLGCNHRVSSGLDWAFSIVEEAIILEDDCLPNFTFFRFCEEMLDRYRDDKRIMSIGGTNVLGEWKSHIQSYHFSYYGGVWGWASWRRAWQYYDINMSLWSSSEIKTCIKDVFADNEQYNTSKQAFDASYQGRVDAWGYRWRLARLIQSGLSIVPSVNLVSNIGCRQDGTHTTYKKSNLAEIATYQLKFPLKFNYHTVVDREFDRKVFEKTIKKSSIFTKIKSKLDLSISLPF